MNKKKLIKLYGVLIFCLFILCFSSKVFATSKIEMTANFQDDSISKGEEADINMNLNKLNDVGQGVNACVFTLEFDTNQFEFIKIEGQNKWGNPVYNENKVSTGNIVFALTRPSFIKEEGLILKITLKAKDNFDENSNLNVKVKDISFAAKIDNTTKKVLVNDVNVTLNDYKDENTDTKENEPEERAKEKEDDTVAKETLPGTGLKRTTLYLFLLIGVSSIICFDKTYRKYKNI